MSVTYRIVDEPDLYRVSVEVYVDDFTFWLAPLGAITPEFIGRARFIRRSYAQKAANKTVKALGAARFKPPTYHQALMAVRDNIAWRIAQKKPTSENERMILFAIDAELDKTDSSSAELPDEAKEILANLKGDDR